MKPFFYQDDYERVIYEKNPLAEVVFQIQFPPLLKIETFPPTEFQERVISNYPLLQIEDGFSISVATNQQAIEPSKPSRSYLFISEKGEWKITLSTGSMALSTNNYECWEGFEDRLKSAIDALFKCYSIAHITRVSLRYRDIIDREALGLEEKQWSELLVPVVVGWLSDETDPQSNAMAFNSSSRFSLGEDTVNIQSGMVENIETKKKAFLLDADFFIETRTSAQEGEVIEHADRLHQYTGPFFRWCITPSLHTALKPKLAESE